MSFFKIFSVVTLGMFLLGCIGMGSELSVKQELTSPHDGKYSYEINFADFVTVPQLAKNIFNNRLKSELGKRGILSDETGAEVAKVEITFRSYRMRNGAARFSAGAFAGSDNIDTLIVVKSVKDGAIVGEFEVKSENNTGIGTSKGLIEGHADEIVAYLSGEKK